MAHLTRWRSQLKRSLLVNTVVARAHGRDLHRLSFTGTLHRLRDVCPLVLRAGTRAQKERLVAQLLQWIADDRVPDRPHRFEPRRRKRRPREYSLLNRPRRWYHLYGDEDAR